MGKAERELQSNSKTQVDNRLEIFSGWGELYAEFSIILSCDENVNTMKNAA